MVPAAYGTLCSTVGSMVTNPTAAMAADTDWHSVADELASALRQSLLRNPSLPGWAWTAGQDALKRYDGVATPDGPTSS